MGCKRLYPARFKAPARNARLYLVLSTVGSATSTFTIQTDRLTHITLDFVDRLFDDLIKIVNDTTRFRLKTREGKDIIVLCSICATISITKNSTRFNRSVHSFDEFKQNFILFVKFVAKSTKYYCIVLYMLL